MNEERQLKTVYEEKKEMFEKVKEIIVDTISCNPDDVKLESRLEEDLSMDSLDAVQVNMNIKILNTLNYYIFFDTVQLLVNYLLELIKILTF